MLHYIVYIICDVALESVSCSWDRAAVGERDAAGNGERDAVGDRGRSADDGPSGDGPHASGLGWAAARQTLLSGFGSLVSCPD